ncbi:MAG TPA: class I SAM-dependent rRNA methyltransferase [Saprospiraceae bacterium]|nr:class I SAM-dependent rRNA methyltransferase [Saprospiraceae bacterium]HMP25879.1 class I SAM-dependent rRNA methyltransferase [Saprospiraceae bacterium]
MKKITLKDKKDASLRRFHPWVFSGAVADMDAPPADGEVVEVYARNGTYLATGHYQQSSICVRIFSFVPTDAGQAFWTQKMQQAHYFRKKIGLPEQPKTNCYRLVHAEGDGLPGLIVDIYNGVAVLQCHSIGMHLERAKLTQALLEVCPQLEAVFDKSAETLPEQYARTMQNGYLYGSAAPRQVLENGHTFLVNWETGQKTGFFLDQRDNRQLLERYVAGKSVLNAFCYSGGFSIYALRAGARMVHSVDVSQKAIELTMQNVALNAPFEGHHKAYAQDVLHFLQKTEQTYEVMVVDPPAFAKNIAKRHNAVQGYKRLNALAIKKISAGGILFTFSCSQAVDRQLFYDTIVAAALEAGRQIRVIHHLNQPADHPVSLFHPEGAYLKGLVLFVT